MTLIRDLRDAFREILLKDSIDGKKINALYSKKDHLLFWGSSPDAVKLIQKLSSIDIQVSAIIDNSTTKQGVSIMNIPIIGPEKIEQYSPSKIIIMSRFGNRSIAKQLMLQNKLFDIDFAEHPLIEPHESVLVDLPASNTAEDASAENLEGHKPGRLVADIKRRLTITPESSLGWQDRSGQAIDSDSYKDPF